MIQALQPLPRSSPVMTLGSPLALQAAASHFLDAERDIELLSRGCQGKSDSEDSEQRGEFSLERRSGVFLYLEKG